MSNSEKALAVLRESQQIIDAETLLRTPVEELTQDAQLIAWSVLDSIEKGLVKKRKEDLRKSLMKVAELGKEDEKGSFVYEVAGTGGSVKKQKSQKKDVFIVDKLKKLLKKKNISEETVIVYKPVVNEKVIDSLIENGVIKPKEYDAVTEPGKVGWSLIVKKPHSVKKLLNE